MLHPNLIHRTQCLTPEPKTKSPTQTPKPTTTSPKLPARLHTDPLNPAHPNSPLGVRQIRIILLHPNLINRTQCLTPEPRTQNPTQTPEPETTSPKLFARCQTDSFNPLPPKPHPPNTVSDTRTQYPKPNPNTSTQTPQPKTPHQSLNYSRPALKTKNPATEIAGFLEKKEIAYAFLRIRRNTSNPAIPKPINIPVEGSGTVWKLMFPPDVDVAETTLSEPVH